MVRMRTLPVLFAVVSLTVGVATAAAGGGNSANAKLCQKGGWQSWVRADHTPFVNQGDCVSYGAQGGTLTSPSAKIGDLNGDGKVDDLDLSILLSHFGQMTSIGDLNGDGVVDVFDLSILLSNFGT